MEITAYLDDKTLGLGNDFADEVKRCENFIRKYPYTWQSIRNGIRRLTTERFKYNVFYIIRDDEYAEILTVMHEKRKPYNFMGRL
jgi:plasmid stabilization system protein ParE